MTIGTVFGRIAGAEAARACGYGAAASRLPDALEASLP
jgi:hypothetical protein